MENRESPVKLKDIHRVYFIGAGGIGMSALARWFNQRGQEVAGYDRTATVLTSRLEAEGMALHFADDISLVPAAFREDKAHTLVVFTPAVPQRHTELNWFRDNGFTVMKRSELLGLITQNHFTVAVAGTHGKTTTSSIIAHLLCYAEAEMVAFLGGIAANYSSNLVLSGTGPAEQQQVVVEADEFDRSFLRLFPNIGVVTSADPDHLDIYGDADSLRNSFADFVGQVNKEGMVFLHDSIADDLSSRTAFAGRQIRYGIDRGELRAERVQVVEGAFCFDLVWADRRMEQVEMPLPGFHNVENALVALAVGLELGIDEDMLRKGLAAYKGVKRRFEFVLREEGRVFIDDYAHHPREIAALLRSVRTLYPEQKATVIFQPHLYSRTNDFAEGFAEILAEADDLILLPIYPAREEPMPGVTSQMLIDKMQEPRGQVMSKEEAIAYVRAAKPSLLLTVGAGDIDAQVVKLKEALTQ